LPASDYNLLRTKDSQFRRRCPKGVPREPSRRGIDSARGNSGDLALGFSRHPPGYLHLYNNRQAVFSLENIACLPLLAGTCYTFFERTTSPAWYAPDTPHQKRGPPNECALR